MWQPAVWQQAHSRRNTILHEMHERGGFCKSSLKKIFEKEEI
jgi:hypothetical protein